MSFNPVNEIRYRYRLAIDHLKRAERLFGLRDWAGTVSASQLSVENFAKAVIAIFEVPTWGHDPSSQLKELIGRFPSNIRDSLEELASLVSEIAPEHGRSSYGEPAEGLTPSDIYREEHATETILKTRRAKEIIERVLSELNVRL